MTEDKKAKADRPKTLTVTLEEPVTLTLPGEDRARTFTELTLRRMKGKDALVAEGETNKARAGYLMFAALADVPVEVIEELDMEDIAAVGEAAGKLMGKRVLSMAEREAASQERNALLAGGTSSLQ